MWLIAKENPTINKLIEIMERTGNVIGAVIAIILSIIGCMLVYKIFFDLVK